MVINKDGHAEARVVLPLAKLETETIPVTIELIPIIIMEPIVKIAGISSPCFD